MIMGPEAYYSSELEGKSADEIMKCIRSLKKNIKQLKDIMEHPEYVNREEIILPSESTELSCTRLYLERVKQALIEAGGEYKPTKAEIKAQEFQDNIPYINKIVFSIGSFFEGREVRTYILDDDNDKVHLYLDHSVRYKVDGDKEECECDLTKQELLKGLEKLYIGEWLRDYDSSRFDYYILDGTQWDLEFYFYNGHRAVKKYGSNSYPYNFREFCELIGFDYERKLDL